MRYTRRVSVWPVAFVGGLRYESPKVSPAGKVVGWKTVFDPNRPFAIDMAGFAISIKLILEKPQASFKLEGVKGGYQETSLLKDLVTMDGLEPKAANCTKVSRTRDLEETFSLLAPGCFYSLLPCSSTFHRACPVLAHVSAKQCWDRWAEPAKFFTGAKLLREH